MNLPNLATKWPSTVGDNIIQLTWNASSFIRSSTNATSAVVSTLVSASHVSTVNLKAPRPPSLLKALHEDNAERAAWAASPKEEKDALAAADTCKKISFQEHRRLPQSVPKAIPSMCVLTIKRDENMNPDCAKTRIVILGNLESGYWQKSKKYAPVLQHSSLRLLTSMATESPDTSTR